MGWNRTSIGNPRSPFGPRPGHPDQRVAVVECTSVCALRLGKVEPGKSLHAGSSEGAFGKRGPGGGKGTRSKFIQLEVQSLNLLRSKI